MTRLLALLLLALPTFSQEVRPNLQMYDLPAGLVKGIKIGKPNTWPRAELHIPNPKENGAGGVRITGKGVEETFVHLNDWGASISIGQDSGRIEIRNCTIIGAKDYGIKFGGARGDWFVRKHRVDTDGDGVNDSWEVSKDEDGHTLFDYEVLRTEHYPDAVLVLRNVRLVTDQPANGPPTRTKWLVHSTNVDHFWDQVYVDGKSTAEHALYAHGVAKRGIYWVQVYVDAIGAEACKVATRPWEAFFVPNASLTLDQCVIEDFGQPTSNWQDGGCVILQGSGLSQITLTRSVFKGRPGNDREPSKDTLVSLSDGLSTVQNKENNQRRYYDVISGLEAGDAPAGHAANGHVLINECAFLGFGRKKSLQTQTLYPDYEEDFDIAQHNTVRSWKMTNCVGVGGARGSLRFVENDQVKIAGCNTPRLLHWAEEELGWDVSEEMELYTPVGNGKLSGF